MLHQYCAEGQDGSARFQDTLTSFLYSGCPHTFGHVLYPLLHFMNQQMAAAQRLQESVTVFIQ